MDRHGHPVVGGEDDEPVERVDGGADREGPEPKSAEWLARQQKLRETEWAVHEKCIAAAERAFEAFMEKTKVYANLADIARILEVASKLGRLASGLATDKTEITGNDGGPIQIELNAALRKIYGPVVDVDPVNPALESGDHAAA